MRSAVFGFIILSGLLLCGCTPPGAGSRPNVILISIDTLRADHVGVYGYSRPTSPNLDRLAGQGVRFADVVTQSTGTIRAHKSVLSSALPALYRAAPEDFPTLAGRLRTVGYQTAAFVDGGLMRAQYGHDSGFELYVDNLAEAAPEGGRPVADRKGGGFAAILPRAEEWLQKHGSEPFFLFLHTYDVHCPYEPPAEYAAMFTAGRPAPLDIKGMCGKTDFRGVTLSKVETDWIRDHYDAGIRYTDELLGRFLSRLEKLGLRQNTIIMVFSDHGESLGEQGWIGHNRLFLSQLFVPWIMAGPGLPAGRVVDTPAMLMDLVPTLLDYLDLPPAAGALGVSLKPAVEGEALFPAGRLRICEVKGARGLMKDPWFLIQLLNDGSAWSLFRSDRDPHGSRNLVHTRADIAEELLAEWSELAEQWGIEPGDLPEEKEVLDEKIRRELRTLGYID